MSNPPLGISHFFSHADTLGKALFVVLILMSLATWYFIITKTITLIRMRRASGKFVSMFWNASTLDEVRNEINTHGADEPFAHLTSHALFARENHQRIGGSKIGEAGSLGDFLTRSMRKVIEEETARLENGLTVLATVGATAPFVGLLGTVWGVYGALVSIGMSGAGTIDKVAGPVGEALVMTGMGLAVALPSVVAYNSFTRNNRLTLAGLDAFAHDLFAYLTTGLQTVPSNAGKVHTLHGAA